MASTGMLAVLRAAERRVLLAHERAHLDHRHDLYTALAAIAGAANPLLGRLPAAVGLATERWADEVAATQVGDRRLAARALARAALAASRTRQVRFAVFSHPTPPNGCSPCTTRRGVPAPDRRGNHRCGH